MPCNCSGLRVEKCSCALVPCSRSVILTHTKASGQYYARPPLPGTPSSVMLKILESLYEKCAGYNLRYCPFHEFVKTKGVLSDTLKDVVVLLCFLVANSVVLLAILAKMTLHVSYVLIQSAQWLKGYYIKKNASRNMDLAHINRISIAHDFTPHSSGFI